MKILTFFNNKGGVGKTSLVYHLAWMFAELGKSVLVADIDPQANLSSMFLSEDRLEDIWEKKPRESIMAAIEPLMTGMGDINEPAMKVISDKINLIVGDLRLAKFETDLSDTWSRCLDEQQSIRSFRVTTAFYRILCKAFAQSPVDFVFIDIGPNLGAINRSALIATDYVVVPLTPDIYSIQGLRNLGPTLKEWRNGWTERRKKFPTSAEFIIPEGNMRPIGYVVQQHSVRKEKPVKAYQKWIDRIPNEYTKSVLADSQPSDNIQRDYCLATIKHYRSLMPIAMERRKPMFKLTAADGAFGAHYASVNECYDNFKSLAEEIIKKSNS